MSFCNNIKFYINLDWHILSYGYCHTFPCPADAQLSTPPLIHPKRVSHPGTSLRDDYHQSIEQLEPTNNRTRQSGEMCHFALFLSFSAIVIEDSISYLSRLTALPYLIFIFIDRWPVTGWREGGEERRTNGKGAERKRMRVRESRTHEIPRSQWEPLALPASDLKRIKWTLPKEGFWHPYCSVVGVLPFVSVEVVMTLL